MIVVVLIVVVVFPVLIVVVVRESAPDDSIVKQADKPLEITGVEGGCEGLSMGRHHGPPSTMNSEKCDAFRRRLSVAFERGDDLGDPDCVGIGADVPEPGCQGPSAAV